LKEVERLKKISKIGIMSSILLILSKKKSLKNPLGTSFPAGRINKHLLPILNCKFLLYIFTFFNTKFIHLRQKWQKAKCEGSDKL
jgi:hypothetical protein